MFASGSGVFVTPVDAGAPPVQLAAGPAAALWLAADGTRVVHSRMASGEITEILSVPTSGGPSVSLALAPAGGRIEDLELDPSSRHVVYRTEVAGVRQLFAIALDGAGGLRRLNRPLPAGGTIAGPNYQGFSHYAPTSGARVVYFGEQDTDGVRELYLSVAEVGPERGRLH